MPVRKHKSSISFAKRVVKSDTKVVIQHTPLIWKTSSIPSMR